MLLFDKIQDILHSLVPLKADVIVYWSSNKQRLEVKVKQTVEADHKEDQGEKTERHVLLLDYTDADRWLPDTPQWVVRLWVIQLSAEKMEKLSNHLAICRKMLKLDRLIDNWMFLDKYRNW